jgi:AraC-like DNA-binding protein
VLQVPVQLNRYAQLVVDDENGDSAILMRGAQRDGAFWIECPSSLFAKHPLIAEAEIARLVWNTRVMFVNSPEFQKLRYPRVVHFMREAPPYAREFERIFDAPVVFGSDWNAMQFDSEFLALKQPPVNRYVFGVLSDRADALLKTLQQTKTIRGRVETILMTSLHTGEVSMDAVAQKLELSRQTLYRKLRTEGVTFEDVLDELRHKLALHFLGGKKVSVNETAYLVGFSDPAAFSRAFKRWTGMSPREARDTSRR